VHVHNVAAADGGSPAASGATSCCRASDSRLKPRLGTCR